MVTSYIVFIVVICQMSINMTIDIPMLLVWFCCLRGYCTLSKLNEVSVVVGDETQEEFLFAFDVFILTSE